MSQVVLHWMLSTASPPLGAISDAIPGCASMAEDTPPESPSEASQEKTCAGEAPAQEMPLDEDNRPETS